jgi:ferredoxin
MIKKCIGGVENKTFYVCGPDIMYRFCCGEMERLDIPRRRVRREVAGPPQRVTQDPGWPQDIAEGRIFRVSVAGRDIPARAGDPLIISLERAGLVIPSACRSGECSLCRTKLLSGSVFHPAAVRLRKSDRRFGYIHPCLAYPLSDLNLLIWP